MTSVLAALATGQTSVVISNLAYLVGAVVLAIVVISVVAIRHHRPRSTEEDMDEFHRGLAALNPDRVEYRRSGLAHLRRNATRFETRRASTPRPANTRSKTG